MPYQTSDRILTGGVLEERPPQGKRIGVLQ
jgi:hypothetical protein